MEDDIVLLDDGDVVVAPSPVKVKAKVTNVLSVSNEENQFNNRYEALFLLYYLVQS